VLAQFAEWSEWDERPVYATLRRGKHRRLGASERGRRTSFKSEIKLSSFDRARPGTSFEEPPQARLVKIAHGRLAAWLDPFGMLPSQVVVNLSLKLGHGVSWVTDWFGRNHARGKHKLLDKPPADLFIRNRCKRNGQ
jgi:hypothetical protein